jgi:hypothetical protein
MNVNHLIAYSLKNTTASELCGVPAKSSVIFLLNPKFYYTNGLDSILDAVNSQKLEVYDISGNLIPYYIAYTTIQSIGAEVLKFTQKMKDSSSISATHHLMVRLEWNLTNANAIIALVGGDIHGTDFSKLDVTKSDTISKTLPILPKMSIGYYSDALITLNAMSTDSFFTSDRIAVYNSIISGIDAFNFEL